MYKSKGLGVQVKILQFIAGHIKFSATESGGGVEYRVRVYFWGLGRLDYAVWFGEF
jgi:hypothetical protein